MTEETTHHQHIAQKQVRGDVEQANPSKQRIDYAELNFGVTTIEYASEQSPFSFSGFRVVTRFSDSDYETITENIEWMGPQLASEIISENGGWDYTE